MNIRMYVKYFTTANNIVSQAGFEPAPRRNGF